MNEIPKYNIPPNVQEFQEEEVHLSDYVAVLNRRRKIAIWMFLAVFAGVAAYTFLAKPVYEASATLHVKDEKVQGGDFLGDLGLSRENPIETEIEILKSRTNVEEVVRRLHLNWVVDKKKGEPAFRIVEFSSSAEEPVYKVVLTGGGAFKVTDEEKNTVASGKSGTVSLGKNFSLLLDDLTGEKGNEFRLTLASFNGTVQGLRNSINASEVGKGTNILRVSYQNNDPAVASKVVNTLAQVYLERSIDMKTQEASRSVQFIGEQLESLQLDLRQAENELEAYKSNNGVVQLDAEAQSLIERLTEAEKSLAAIRLRQRQGEFALEALQKAIGRGESYSPAILLQEPVVATLAQKLAELEVEKRGLLVEFSAMHPAVENLQDRISEIQRKLLENYRTIISGLKESAEGLENDMARYEAGLKKLPQSELDLARLTRKATVNADIYTFLLQKHEEARIAKASTISNINVIDPAIVADKPVKPQKKKNLLLGIIVGLMLAVGAAFFREYMDDSIKDSEEAKRLLGLPVLATIPFIGSPEKGRKKKGKAIELERERFLIARTDPRSAAAEAFRALRTGIHFARAGQKNQVLLLTSTMPGEGKSTSTANLAVTMAQAGKKTIIIGCDLRKPTLDAIFQSDTIPGLTDYLVEDAPLDNVLRHAGDLDFITAGTIPPNPAELLGSDRMRLLLEELRSRYDIILLDAPPVLAVTDAVVLTRFADRAMVVLEIGRVRKKAAVQMMETLRDSHVPIAGLILNDRTKKGPGYYGYYGAYYGSYGYGQKS